MSRSTASSTASSSRSRAIFRYDSDDEDNPSHSTGASGKRRKREANSADTNDETVDRLVSDCVKYLLIADHKKTVIKRSDMFKMVAKNLAPNRKTCDEVMAKVRSELSHVFGIELVDCPDVSNGYILVNKLPVNGLQHVIDSNSIADHQLYRSGLLSVVLALIFMSGQSCPEELMWRFLAKLGFDVNSKSQNLHLNEGLTIKKLMTEQWVRQMYLKYDKIARSDPVVHEFRWGLRAEKEFNKLDVLKFVCQVLADGSQPEYWRTQYAIAVQDSQTNGTPAHTTDSQTLDDEIVIED